METEDTINLPTSSVSDIESENDASEDCECKPDMTLLSGEADYMDEGANGEIPENDGNDGSEGDKVCLATKDGKDLENSHSTFQDSVKLPETITVQEAIDIDHPNGYQQHDQSSKIDPSVLSGVKRPRSTLGEEQPSVRVIYNSLTRETKHKLEELLQQWSQWSAEHGSSLLDSEGVLESGEETYFPALRIGVDKPFAVSFWMDNLSRKKENKGFTPFDANSVPLYDRGFSFTLSSTDGSSNLEGGLQVVNASRCFNCGSYSHSLKDCPKARDNVAVNIARKQHKSNRNKNAANPSRYYRNSQKGKYDGLKPGVLDPETRKLLGLGELDPLPWLHRMREIGYPPGYVDPEDEDLPSGITIYGDEEIKEETEERGILKNSAEPPKKKSIEFPGMNAPIPDNVDERRWAAGPSNFTPSRTHSHSRHSHTSDTIKRGHYLEQHRPWDTDFAGEGPIQWRFRDIENEGEGPPRLRFSNFENEGPPHWWFREFEDESPLHWRFRDFEDGDPRQWRFRDFEDGGPRQWRFSDFEDGGPRQWRFRDFEEECPRRWLEINDEMPPPGCELDPEIRSLSYRYRAYDSINGPMDSLGRSLSDRLGRSPLVDDCSFFHSSYPRY